MPKPSAVPLRIYVACLASYNAGTLHGAWIDADQDADSIHEEAQAMLKASPEPDAEEWAIHAYEGFGDLRLSESENFTTISQLAAFIEEHEEVGLAVLAHCDGDLEEATRTVENYMGTYASLADYAQELTEQQGIKIPDYLSAYIDYEGMARDMELNGDVFTVEISHDKVMVFLNR